MSKKNLLTKLTSFVLAFVMIMSLAGNISNAAEATPTDVPDEEESELYIGDKESGVEKINLSNLLGSDISSLSIVKENDPQGVNLIPEGEVFSVNENRSLYFKTEADVIYEMYITYAGKTDTIKAIDFSKIKKGDDSSAKVRSKDGKVYIEYLGTDGKVTDNFDAQIESIEDATATDVIEETTTTEESVSSNTNEPVADERVNAAKDLSFEEPHFVLVPKVKSVKSIVKVLKVDASPTDISNDGDEENLGAANRTTPDWAMSELVNDQGVIKKIKGEVPDDYYGSRGGFHGMSIKTGDNTNPWAFCIDPTYGVSLDGNGNVSVRYYKMANNAYTDLMKRVIYTYIINQSDPQTVLNNYQKVHYTLAYIMYEAGQGTAVTSLNDQTRVNNYCNLVGRSDMASSIKNMVGTNSDVPSTITNFIIYFCRQKVKSGDSDAWQDFITYTYNRQNYVPVNYYIAIHKDDKMSRFLSPEGIVYDLKGQLFLDGQGKEVTYLQMTLGSDGWVKSVKVGEDVSSLFSAEVVSTNHNVDYAKITRMVLESDASKYTNFGPFVLQEDVAASKNDNYIVTGARTAADIMLKADTYKIYYGITAKSKTGVDLINNPDYTGDIKQEDALIDQSVPLPIRINKSSSDTSCLSNPNYTLANTKYAIYTNETDANGDTNRKGTFTISNKDGGTSNTINVTDYMSVKDGKMENTTFWFREVYVGHGYQKNDIFRQTVPASYLGSSTPYQIDVKDKPVFDPFNIKITKQGGTSATAPKLEGAVFTIKHYSELTSGNFTFEQLSKKKPDHTYTLTTDAKGETDTLLDLQLGYITVEETTAPDGYSLDGATATVNGKKAPIKMCFVLDVKGSQSAGYEKQGPVLITDDGKRSTEIALKTDVQNQLLISDESERGDLSIQKKDYDGKDLEGIQFKITNKETEETATVTTDENGYVSTESVYKKHSDGGVWFKYVTKGGGAEAVDDTKGALPVGTYEIEELAGDDGKYQILPKPITVKVTKDHVTRVFEDDKTDTAEVIYDTPYPEIGTLAVLETENGNIKTLPAKPGQKLTDICEYKWLRSDTTYTLVGSLMIKDEDGNIKAFTDKDGNPVTAKTTFTTEGGKEKSSTEKCGTVKVVFEDLDLTDFDGSTFVVYEKLYLGTETEGSEVKETYDDLNTVVKFPLKHEDPDDADQTVKVPTIGTEATAPDGTKTVSNIEDTVTIVDRVAFRGLEVGRSYVVSGTLMNKETGKELLDENDKPITASKTFTAETSDGYVDITFTFNAKILKKKKTTIVAFERVEEEETGIEVAVHASIESTPQTTYNPVISTTAKGTNGRNELLCTESKFIDTVSIYNVEPNSTFTLRGVAMDKKTGEALILNGKRLEATATFTSGAKNNEIGGWDGTVDVEFIIPEGVQEELKGKDIVIFEELVNTKGTVVATHNDINSSEQELTVPTIRTTLTDVETGTHIAYPDEEVTLVDVVKYSNLIPGKSGYIMRGTLMVKSTGKELLDENGNPITAETTFTASETGSGTVELTFKFNARLLKLPGESVVAFESCYPGDGNLAICVEASIDDDEQTVRFCEVKTKVATASFSNKKDISLTDTILYKNFKVGYKYVAKAVLVDKDGNPVKVNGKEIRAEKSFECTTEDGTVDVTFPTFSGASLSGKYVVFEEVYVDVKGDGSVLKLVGDHKDLNDKDQTITVSSSPKTGDTMPIILLIAILVIAGLGMGITLVVRKRLNK